MNAPIVVGTGRVLTGRVGTGRDLSLHDPSPKIIGKIHLLQNNSHLFFLPLTKNELNTGRRTTRLSSPTVNTGSVVWLSPLIT